MSVPMLGLAALVASALAGVVVLLARGNSPWLRFLWVGVGILLASLPLGAVVTLALMPAWAWFEATTGIESVGHSGPAAWCYLVGSLACAATLGLLYGVKPARKRASTSRRPLL